MRLRRLVPPLPPASVTVQSQGTTLMLDRHHQSLSLSFSLQFGFLRLPLSLAVQLSTATVPLCSALHFFTFLAGFSSFTTVTVSRQLQFTEKKRFLYPACVNLWLACCDLKQEYKEFVFWKNFFYSKATLTFSFFAEVLLLFFLKTLINFLKFFFSDAYFFLYWEAPKYRSIFVSVFSCEVLLSGNLEIIYLPSNSFQCNLVHHRQILSLVLYQLWNAANVPLLFLLLTRGCSSTSSTHSTQQQHLIELIVT